MSSAQKGQITKLQKEYGHAIKYPEKFHIAKVGKETAKQLKASGFKVTPDNKALIPLHDYTEAKIVKGKIKFKAGRYEETVYLSGSKDFHKNLKKLSETKFPANSMITARIGYNNFFSRSRFHNYADLFHYVQNVFQAKDKNESTKRLQGLMSVVTLKGISKNNITPPKKGNKKNAAKKKGRK